MCSLKKHAEKASPLHLGNAGIWLRGPTKKKRKESGPLERDWGRSTHAKPFPVELLTMTIAREECFLNSVLPVVHPGGFRLRLIDFARKPSMELTDVKSRPLPTPNRFLRVQFKAAQHNLFGKMHSASIKSCHVEHARGKFHEPTNH